jgi:dynein heavy chain
LSDEAIKELVDKMLNEVNELYFDSIRKSIIDYILMEDEEKRRLGIM